jgi:peptide/nickel transport system permease protein
MTVASSPAVRPAPRGLRAGRVGRVVRRALRTRRGRLGLLLTLLVVAVAFLGPLIPSHSPTALRSRPFAAPGSGHGLLGTDDLGRDVLARVLHGGWRLLLLAVASTVLAVVLGAMAGVVAAYRGGWVDGVVMRLVDVVLGIPQLVFVLVLVSMVGPKAWLVILGVGLSHAPQIARVVRAAALDVAERDYVKAIAAWGVPPRTVVRRHVLPSLLTPLVVEFSLKLNFAIILIAGLSFLGFGTQVPDPDWGVMINENRIGLSSNLWAVLAPATLLAVLAVGVNTLSDALARANLPSSIARDAP